MTMAARHRDEITAIIDACGNSLTPHKVIALWSRRSGKPKPIGHNAATVAFSTQMIAQARSACFESHRGGMRAPSRRGQRA